MSDGLLNRLETAQDERDYYKARLAEAHASLAEGDKRYAAENARLQARLAEAERLLRNARYVVQYAFDDESANEPHDADENMMYAETLRVIDAFLRPADSASDALP